MVNLLYPKADYIVFQTNEAKELFKKSIQKKGVVIANPFNFDGYASETEFDHNLITFAGRYCPQKIIDTIFNAAEIIKTKYPDVRFELYGTGPSHDELAQMIKDKNLSDTVLLNENIPNIGEKMKNSRLFVMSSLYEGMSNSLMEASFSGVPCLTTPVLGSSIIKNGENGYFFNFKDYQQLANIIIELLDNEDKYNKLRKASLKIAKSLKHSDSYDEWLNIIQ